MLLFLPFGKGHLIVTLDCEGGCCLKEGNRAGRKIVGLPRAPKRPEQPLQ